LPAARARHGEPVGNAQKIAGAAPKYLIDITAESAADRFPALARFLLDDGQVTHEVTHELTH
jgi:hypothetical protein